MSITLYYHPLSPPSRSVLALLNIGGLKFQGKIVDLMKGQARAPDYLKINPFGGVPFLIHNDVSLSQSNAILQYLCDAFPNELRGLYGNDPDERAQVNQLLSWYQGTFRPTLLKPFGLRMQSAKTSKPVPAKSIKETEAAVNQLFRLIDKMLAKSPYLVGDHLTIADLLLFNETINVESYDFDFSYWHNLTAWYKRVQQTAAVGEIYKKFKEGVSMVKGMIAKAVIQK